MELIKYLVNNGIIALHFKFVNQEYCVIVGGSIAVVLVKEYYVITERYSVNYYPYFNDSTIASSVSKYEDVFISDVFSDVNLGSNTEVVNCANICGRYLMDRHHNLKN